MTGSGWYSDTSASNSTTAGSYTWVGTSTSNSTAGNAYFDANSDYYVTEPTWITVTEPYYVPVKLTKAQKAEQRRVAEEQRQRQAEAVARRKLEEQAQAKSEAKAQDLLKEHIGVEAFGELHKVGYIELDSHKPNVRYRIHKDRHQMIDVLKGDKVIDRLCIHLNPKHNCPTSDEILAKILLAEYAEDVLNTKANHHAVRN